MFLLVGTAGRADELDSAKALKNRFPEVRVAVHPELHVKAVSIGPATLYVGSANFGNSNWADITLGVRSQEAHDYSVTEIFQPLWAESTEM